MEEITKERTEETGIDLQRVVSAILQRVWMVIFASVAGAVLAFLITYFMITPQYKASAMFYVNNNSFSVGDTALSISSSDLVTSRGLVDSYVVILKTRETLNDVIDYADSNLSYSQLRGMISAEAVNETEIFEISVTSTDPNEAEQLANAIAYILPKRIGNIIEGTSAKVVDAAVVPSRPSSPSYTKNTLLGFLLGLVMTVALIVLQEVLDITIRSEEDVNQVCNHPILAAVPDMSAPSKGGSYYYGYGSRRDDKSKRTKKYAYSVGKQPGKEPALFGPEISFAASEAYKLLRTKLQFSFTDENECRVIGLSSALSGEGKSLTAVNLAYTLSQLDKKVILIDCDMRRPTLAEKLGIQKKPGLSSYLTGQSHLVDLVQKCNLKKAEDAFSVISAGQNPPNPIELLSSARMKRMLDKLRRDYDYVILDLPPVGEVSDAMAVANETDGMLLVVRQNYCDRVVLTDAARQFAFINSKILGIVFNCTVEHGGNYGKGYYKGHYRRYYRRYYKRYSRNYYEHNDRSVAGGTAQETESKSEVNAG